MADIPHDVVGIGNAIVDVLARTEEDFLLAHGLHKGAMRLIEEAEAERLYEAMGPATIISGGSGKEIDSDKHGRVHLKFRWDREGPDDDKSSPEIRVELGQAWLVLKQPAAAATAFEQALQLDATQRIYHLLGSAREAAGDRSGAIAAYQGELSQPYSQSTAQKARERLKALQS